MMAEYLLLATFMKDDKLQVNVCFFGNLGMAERVLKDYVYGLDAVCELYRYDNDFGFYEFLYRL